MIKRDNYSGLAGYYDFFTARPLSSCRRRIVNVCRENGIKKIVDLACGTGALSFLLWHEAGVRATGVDASPAMLRQARLRRARLRRARSRPQEQPPTPQHAAAGDNAAPAFILGLAETTPFADKTFELAILSLVLHETMVSPMRLMAEAARIADRVLILDYRLAERNLELPAALLAHIPEFLAGREHYAAFREYMRNGALQGLLYQAHETLGLDCPREWSCGGGALGLALCSG